MQVKESQVKYWSALTMRHMMIDWWRGNVNTRGEYGEPDQLESQMGQSTHGHDSAGALPYHYVKTKSLSITHELRWGRGGTSEKTVITDDEDAELLDVRWWWRRREEHVADEGRSRRSTLMMKMSQRSFTDTLCYQMLAFEVGKGLMVHMCEGSCWARWGLRAQWESKVMRKRWATMKYQSLSSPLRETWGAIIHWGKQWTPLGAALDDMTMTDTWQKRILDRRRRD